MIMKRIIYLISIILGSALYSCADQYDNIDQYATDESIYVGKFSDLPYLRIGYKRIEIELLGDSIGRAFADDIYLGKAKRTIIEYDEADGLRRLEFDSVCSWVNITGLTTPKTYIFTIYAEDGEGHRSISTEALGKPFTDADFEGISFPMPNVISAPTTVEFTWENTVSMGVSSPLFRFVELIYSYVDRNNNTLSGKLSARDIPSFNINNLNVDDSTTVIINCRIIPIAETGQILDTLSMVREFVTKTSRAEDYVAARTLRPIETALINPDNENHATIKFGAKTDHLAWTEIRYKSSLGEDSTVIRIDNDKTEMFCPNFERRGMVQIRCAYSPPETDIELVSKWTDYAPFILKYDPKLDGWSVAARHGNHGWSDGVGTQTLWDGGNPMLAIDDDPGSGWHSVLNSPLPQVLIVDMQATRGVSKITLTGGYLKIVEIYLTDNLSINGFTPYKVSWDDGNRRNNYNKWYDNVKSIIPADVPASWGTPIAQGAGEGDRERSYLFPYVPQGRYLILRFPVVSIDWNTYVNINTLDIYSD
jgi:hypothetical protein